MTPILIYSSPVSLPKFQITPILSYSSPVSLPKFQMIPILSYSRPVSLPKFQMTPILSYSSPVSLPKFQMTPILSYSSPVSLPKFQMAPILISLISSGPKKKEHRYACLREAKAPHSHRTWTEVSSSVPHFLQIGLLLSPTTYKCLLKVSCLIKRPKAALGCVQLKAVIGPL